MEETDTARRTSPLTTSTAAAHGDWRKNKRARKAYSCIPCHKRKAKCNRSRPCESCVKRGEPSNCVWETEAANAQLPVDEREKLLARIRDLENALVNIRRGDAVAPAIPAGPPPICPLKRHLLSMHIQGNLFEQPKSFPFANLWEGDTVDVLFDVLPSKMGMDKLMDIFWTQFDPVHPIYARKDLAALHESFWQQSETARLASPPFVLAMFFAVLAIGVYVSGGDERLPGLPFQVYEGETVVQARQRAGRATAGVFASAAWHALRVGAFLGAPSVQSVAAMLWLQCYLVHEERPRDTWMMHGLTVRAAVHVLRDGRGGADAERVWRYVVYEEAYLAFMFGEPGMPLSTVYPRPAGALGPEDAYEAGMWAMTLLMERVVALRARGAPPVEEVRALDRAIRAWKAALPPEMDESVIEPELETLGFARIAQVTKLAFEYHHMHISLHRGYEDRYEEGSQEWTYAKEMFAQALHGITQRWLATHRMHPDSFIANGSLAYIALHVSFECCAYAARHPKDEWRSKVKTDAQKIMLALHESKATNPVAAKGLVFLEEKLASLP